jgi:hypothetical protein
MLTTCVLHGGICGNSRRNQDSSTGGGCGYGTEEFTHHMRANSGGTKSLALDHHQIALLARQDVYAFVTWTTSSHH